ncbi:MAG: Smr/MutS family endonuclease [Proteobacteria bacterium]|nr:Smr/MutS family endonuclease [Pseudomonadota bacterium]
MSLSDEEKALLSQMMQGVKPLKKSNKVETKKELKPILVRNRPAKEIKKTSPSLYLSDYYYDPVKAESILSYSNTSLPSKRMKELKQGKIPIDARLDLHGLKKEAAKEALIHFINKNHEQNKRCLLIIHGKGSIEGDAPILKNLVNRWLKQFDEILAFHSALAKHGGNGALYVLLKSNRIDY